MPATPGRVPDNTPVLAVNVMPLGNDPEYTLYVIGASPVATTLAEKAVCWLKVPKVPAGVLQAGVPEYCKPGTAIVVAPSVFTTYNI